MYHDLGLRFDSPTINLYIYPEDFIKLLKNSHYFLESEMDFIKDYDEPSSLVYWEGEGQIQ